MTDTEEFLATFTCEECDWSGHTVPLDLEGESGYRGYCPECEATIYEI